LKKESSGSTEQRTSEQSGDCRRRSTCRLTCPLNSSASSSIPDKWRGKVRTRAQKYHDRCSALKDFLLEVRVRQRNIALVIRHVPAPSVLDAEDARRIQHDSAV
jgi:hypothetical protein